MQQILIMGILALVILIGGITYLGIAGAAIIYCLGGNGSPRNRRILFGILGKNKKLKKVLDKPKTT